MPACLLAGVERGISPLQASLAPDGASFAILSPEGERAMAVPHPLPTLAAGAAPTLASPAPPYSIYFIRIDWRMSPATGKLANLKLGGPTVIVGLREKTKPTVGTHIDRKRTRLNSSH